MVSRDRTQDFQLSRNRSLNGGNAICRRSLEIGLGPRTDVVVNEFERGDGYQTTREDDQADPDVAS